MYYMVDYTWRKDHYWVVCLVEVVAVVQGLHKRLPVPVQVVAGSAASEPVRMVVAMNADWDHQQQASCISIPFVKFASVAVGADLVTSY